MAAMDLKFSLFEPALWWYYALAAKSPLSFSDLAVLGFFSSVLSLSLSIFLLMAPYKPQVFWDRMAKDMLIFLYLYDSVGSWAALSSEYRSAVQIRILTNEEIVVISCKWLLVHIDNFRDEVEVHTVVWPLFKPSFAAVGFTSLKCYSPSVSVAVRSSIMSSSSISSFYASKLKRRVSTEKYFCILTKWMSRPRFIIMCVNYAFILVSSLGSGSPPAAHLLRSTADRPSQSCDRRCSFCSAIEPCASLTGFSFKLLFGGSLMSCSSSFEVSNIDSAAAFLKGSFGASCCGFFDAVSNFLPIGDDYQPHRFTLSPVMHRFRTVRTWSASAYSFSFWCASVSSYLGKKPDLCELNLCRCPTDRPKFVKF